MGANCEYYKCKWRGQPERQSFASWNWPAFLIPVYWLAYRKMYLEAFLCAVIIAFFMLIPGSGLVIHIVVGIFANSLYRQKALRTVRQSLQMTQNEAELYLIKHGGTSIVGMVVAIVIVVFIVVGGIVAIAFSGTQENEVSSQTQTVQSESGDVRFASKKTQDVVTTNGGIIYTIPDDFTKQNSDGLDLRYQSVADGLSFAVVVFEPEDLTGNITQESLMNIIMENVNQNSEYTPVTDVQLPELGDSVSQGLFSTVSDGMKIYCHYSCQKVGDHYAMTILGVTPSKWKKVKDLCGDIILSARPAGGEV